jgi:DNA polymerase I-like protein with 3'-5' exonuclease and polymerase domains
MTVKRRVIITRNKSLTTSLPFAGSLTAPIYIVVDPVVTSNVGFKMPLSKNQMEWFVDRLRTYGKFRKEDVCIISCAPPCTPEVWQSGRQTTAHLKEHHDELITLIRTNKPKLILPFGAKASQQIIGRAVQITKLRGQPIQDENVAFGIPLLPMLSPFYAQRQPENEATFNADLQTAGRIARADFDVEASAIDYKHDYKWCYDLQWLIDLKPKRLSVDVESVGLIAFSPKSTVLTVQICWGEGKSVIVPINYDRGKYRFHNFIPWDEINRPRLLRQLKKLMENPKIEKFGQNFKFDWMMFWYKLGIEVKNYADDTLLLAHLLDENQTKRSIDDLVRQHVPEMAGYNDQYNNDPDHHGKTRMDLLPPYKMLPYGCGDTDAAWRLCDVLHKKIAEDSGLVACYNRVTMPAQRAFCYIELNGFPVSIDELRSFEDALRKTQKMERIYLMRQIPKSIRDKWKDSGVGLKVTRADILRDWLYLHPDGLGLTPQATTKSGLPSISSKQALPYYVADYPVISRLIDYIKNDKLLNTYAKGFYKYIYDGKIRPTYKLASTVTGRSASADPNGQNFPKRGKMAKKYRKIFKAPPGWVFLSCDLSQAELRVAAMMSGDRNMLKVYADGGDIHRTTAAGTMGITLEEFFKLPKDVQDLKRFQAKAVNFGFLYGMWWVKFRQYAKTEYGIDFTEEEAKEIRENFFRTYPMLEVWHKDVQELVYRNGFIRTFDGRIRHLPGVRSPDESVAKQAMRQGINSPVQSIASDLGLMTLGRLMPYLRKRGYDEWFKPCGFIHDAIVCLVREDKVARAAATLKQFMENNPVSEWFGWEPEIPIIADAEVGRTLASTYELKPAQFQGANIDRSFSDLLQDEVNALTAKLANETDEKKRADLSKTIAAVQADMSISLPSPTSRRRVKLTQHRSHTNATRKAATRTESRSFEVRPRPRKRA